MRSWFVALMAGGLILTTSAGEATLRTTNGDVLQGSLIFGTNLLILQPEGGDAVSVPLSEVMELTLPQDSPDIQPTATATNDSPNLDSRPAFEPWRKTRVGTELEGDIREENDVWTLTGGGAGLRGNSDSAFLAERPLDVSGQIVAQLLSFDGTATEAMAGLTLRDNAGEAAAYAFIGQRGDSGLCFQYRQIAGGMTMRLTNAAIAMPAWLRLSRHGGAVVAEASSDGKEWRTLGRANINLGRFIRAGMAITSGSADTVVNARFRQPTVGARGLGYLAASGYPRVCLRGGSVIVAPIESANESVIRFGGDLKGSLVSILNVARIEFVPLTPDLEAHLEPGRSGVLMVDGDFLEGSLRGISTNEVTISSLLLGFRRFAAGSDAVVVQIGAVEPEESDLRVHLRNGSELRARDVHIDPELARAESPLLGSIVFRPQNIQRITRGGLDP